MSKKEEILGVEVLELVDRFRKQQPDESSGHHAFAHHQNGRRHHHPLRRAALTAIEALALVSLARRLDSRRARRFVSVATAAYLKHLAEERHAHQH
ncbi:MAG TPA: hypothetical protein VMT59_16410 [Gaiellaceae bacterium]|nr:hypothetical protein [Gaiellaceae bacterium]